MKTGMSCLLRTGSMAMLLILTPTNRAACVIEPPTTVYPTYQRVDQYFAGNPPLGYFATFDEAYAAELAASGGPMILIYEAPYDQALLGCGYAGQYMYQWLYASVPIGPPYIMPPGSRITGSIAQICAFNLVCPAGYTLPPGSFICYQSPPQSNSGYRITLSGFPAEVEPDGTVRNLRAEVTCDGKSINKEVVLTVKAEAGSGGHNHIPGRPDGSLNPSGGNSPLTFSFLAPAPAGDHLITAKCADNSCGEDTGTVWVGVKGLKQQASSINYILLPNRDVNHPGNHYVTRNTERKVSNFAAAYHEKFPNDPVLHFNDASLIRGGLFDINSNWQLPHETHRLGRNIDVKANEFYHEPSQSIPSRNYIAFWNMGRYYGCYVALHSGATPNEHFHLYCP